MNLKKLDNGNYSLDFNGGIYDVVHNIDLSRVSTRYSDDEFFSCFFFCKKNNSSEFKKIVFECGGGEINIGWLIPTYYYAEPEQFYDDEGSKFLVDFAYAGYEIFLKRCFDVRFISENLIKSNNLVSLGFQDLLKENLYILVVSKEYFKKTKLSLKEFEFLLQLKGIFKIEDPLDIDYYLKFSSDDKKDDLEFLLYSSGLKNIRIKKYHSLFGKNYDVLFNIYNKSLKNIYDISAYLTAYQIFELLMEHMLERKIFEIEFSGIKSWDLKEKLSSITSEKKRLSWIVECVEGNQGDRQIFDELKLKINDVLLNLVQPSELKEKRWIDFVYMLRNIIVHNQLIIYRNKMENNFYAINSRFLKSISEVIRCYL